MVLGPGNWSFQNESLSGQPKDQASAVGIDKEGD